MKPSVLIACEFSGVVRSAFANLGADAWSCDLLPTESPGQHIQGDALEAVRSRDWSLVIAHPPCTYLCNSGVRWLRKCGEIDQDRWGKMVLACDFFASLLASDCPKVCVENPIMHGHARRYLSETWRVLRHDSGPTQIIQPWQFGHPETKATCLWLRGLPMLIPTDVVSGREQRVWKLPPGPDRWKLRSMTYQGVANAMAAQWMPIL